MNSKQRAYLRKLANSVQPTFQVGKGGINENFINQINDLLEARELIKITVLENSLISTRDAAEQISKSTNSDVVQVIGSKLVLYRQAKEKPTIILP